MVTTIVYIYYVYIYVYCKCFDHKNTYFEEEKEFIRN